MKFFIVLFIFLWIDIIEGNHYFIQRPIIPTNSCICKQKPNDCFNNIEQLCLCEGYPGIDCSSSIAGSNLVVDVSTYILNPCSDIPSNLSVRSISGIAGFYLHTHTCGTNVDLNGYNFTFDNGRGNFMNYTGVISGNGNLYFVAAGESDNVKESDSIILSGPYPNRYNGLLVVSKGALYLDKPHDVTAINSDFIIVDNSPFVGIKWRASNQIVDSAVGYIFEAQAINYLSLSNYSETFTGLKISPKTEIRITSPGILYLNYLTYNNVNLSRGIYTENETFIVGSGSVHVGIYPYCASNNPCLNGGTCLPSVTNSLGYVCSCPEWSYGIMCENAKGCISSLCEHGGTCYASQVGIYNCTCASGYSGLRCATNINECESNPCMNGATCIDGVNSFVCNCIDGFNGSRCEKDINACSSSPCMNGGTCMGSIQSFVCECEGTGWKGSICNDVVIDECVSKPCSNGATCINGLHSWSCICSLGYSGLRCQNKINECESSPCLNNGKCNSTINGFQCSCIDGFRGTFCDIVDPFEANKNLTIIVTAVSLPLILIGSLALYFKYRKRKGYSSPSITSRHELTIPEVVNLQCKPIASYSLNDVSRLIILGGFKHCVSKFREYNINGKKLFDLNDDFLQSRLNMKEKELRSKYQHFLTKYFPGWHLKIIDEKELEVFEKLSSNEFVSVHKGYWKEENKFVAIKRIEHISVIQTMQQLLFYSGNMHKLNQKNVVLLYGICFDESISRFSMIIPYYSKGNLHNLLQDTSKRIPWLLRWKFAHETALGMNYLHHQNIVHGNLKSTNLLLTDNLNIKICDVGISVISSSEKKSDNLELMNDETFTNEYDVYCYGKVLYEIATREMPPHSREKNEKKIPNNNEIIEMIKLEKSFPMTPLPKNQHSQKLQIIVKEESKTNEESHKKMDEKKQQTIVKEESKTNEESHKKMDEENKDDDDNKIPDAFIGLIDFCWNPNKLPSFEEILEYVEKYSGIPDDYDDNVELNTTCSLCHTVQQK